MIFNGKWLNNGYIDLFSALCNRDAIVTKGENSSIVYFIDTRTGKKYCFKDSLTSGGRANLPNKEIYESLISFMIKKFTNAVEYFPAVFGDKVGVICEDWNNNVKYCPFTEYVVSKKDALIHKQLMDGYELSDSKVLFELDSLYKIKKHEKLIKEILTDKAFEQMVKIPQHLLVGNLDFNVKNFAVEDVEKGKSNRTKAFDFGFNIFVLLEKYLNGEANISTEDIVATYDYFFDSNFLTSLGIGITRNLAWYQREKDYEIDFLKASREEGFKNNIIDALSLDDKTIEYSFKRIEDAGVKIKPICREIVNRVIDFNRNALSKAL